MNSKTETVIAVIESEAKVLIKNLIKENDLDGLRYVLILDDHLNNSISTNVKDPLYVANVIALAAMRAMPKKH